MTDAASGERWHAIGPLETLAPGEWQAAVRVPAESAGSRAISPATRSCRGSRSSGWSARSPAGRWATA